MFAFFISHWQRLTAEKAHNDNAKGAFYRSSGQSLAHRLQGISLFLFCLFMSLVRLDVLSTKRESNWSLIFFFFFNVNGYSPGRWNNHVCVFVCNSIFDYYLGPNTQCLVSKQKKRSLNTQQEMTWREQRKNKLRKSTPFVAVCVRALRHHHPRRDSSGWPCLPPPLQRIVHSANDWIKLFQCFDLKT